MKFSRKRRNVAKTKATQCKQSYYDVSSFKNKFFVQVRRYIRSLMQENNCEIKNFDVLEILQLKFSCMKIYIENFNFRWKLYDFADKMYKFVDFRRFRQSLISLLISNLSMYVIQIKNLSTFSSIDWLVNIIKKSF
jgi:hypothetical protein